MVAISGMLGIFVSILLILSILVLLFYRLYFLRNPKRIVPKGNTIISPANGKIVRILKINTHSAKKTQGLKKGLLGKVDLLTEDTLGKKGGYVVTIMMTPFNVHYQRAPVAGTVLKTKHSKGKFINAVKDAGSMRCLENEKNEILLRNPKIGKIKVVQVAGFLARRIRCFVRPEQKIHKGRDIGLICLGSQVLLVIPKIKLDVKVGQKVVDGETVIARF